MDNNIHQFCTLNAAEMEELFLFPNILPSHKPIAVKFPLEMKVLEAFQQIKQELEVAALKPINESLPFEVECDASDVAISAALNQGGRLVAFISKILQGSKLKYHII